MGDIIIPYGEKVFGDHDYDILTSSRDGIQFQEDHFSEKQRHDTDGYNIVPKGYCTYRNRSDDGQFTFNINTISDHGIVSKFYPVFSFSGADSVYITNYLNNCVRAKKKLSVLAVGTSQVVLSFETLKAAKFPIPTFEEQEKIGAFIQALDRRIDAQRKLVDTLKLYKRGVSTALFERRVRMKKTGGGTFPDWEKSTLGIVFLERNERASGGENLLAVTINSGVQDRSNLDLKDNSSEDKSNYRKVHAGDIAYNTMRMWQGACGVSAFDGIVSPAYTVIYVADKTKFEPRFWAYLFKETRMLRLFQRNSQGLTSDTWNLKYDKFSKIAVEVPTFDEQVSIADCLDVFSSLIEMHENSLNRMENYKKSLLSRMFI